MTQAKIAALYFDPKTLPLPVSTEEYSVAETPEHFVYFASNAAQIPENFVAFLRDDEEATAPGLESGSYNIFISAEQIQDTFRLGFYFIDEDDRVLKTVWFDPLRYLEAFEEAFEQEMANNAEALLQPPELFEARFSTAYLKEILAHDIEGNDAFWHRFYRDLDIATAPINLLIERLRNDEAIKPVIVIDQNATFAHGFDPAGPTFH